VKKHEKIPGEFVSQVTCSEILISTGIQLVHWAHDIAFTDAAFGEWGGGSGEPDGKPIRAT